MRRVKLTIRDNRASETVWMPEATIPVQKHDFFSFYAFAMKTIIMLALFAVARLAVSVLG